MAQDKRDALLAGWAAAEITPAIPCWMGGYGARTRPAGAIHDPLYAHALALSAATTQARPLVLVICDLLDIHESLLREVRLRAASMLSGATLWVGATHTHSGPATSTTWLPEQARGELDATIERVVTGVLRAAREAVARLHPVYAAWASGETSGIVTNRDHPGSGEDTALDLLCFYNASDKDANNWTGPQNKWPDAIIGSFPCHPTVLSAENYAISADLPGAFRRHLRTLIGDDTWIALATGAAGDMSTRHTRQGQGMAELEWMGALLARQAYQILSEARPLEVAPPVVRQATVELALKDVPAPAVLDAYERTTQERMAAARRAGDVAGARTLETALQGIAALRGRKTTQVSVERSAEVAVARMGRLALVAIPGELYNRLAVAIRSATGFPVLLCGYTNGYAGYLPTRDAYEEIDYEVLMSPFAPGAGEQVAQAVQKLLSVAGAEHG
jgi:neutral ceramidase